VPGFWAAILGGITRKFIGTAEPGQVPAAPSTRLVSLPSSSPTLEYRRHHEVDAPEISKRAVAAWRRLVAPSPATLPFPYFL
jgi:hypothetical protein